MSFERCKMKKLEEKRIHNMLLCFQTILEFMSEVNKGLDEGYEISTKEIMLVDFQRRVTQKIPKGSLLGGKDE